MPSDSVLRGVGRPGPDSGLICGFALRADGSGRTIETHDVAACLADEGAVIWLHFNGAHAGARRWLAQSGIVPTSFLRLIEEHDDRVQVAATPAGVIAAIDDLAFGETVDPSEIVTLWVYASERLLVTARNHASMTADRLRQSARTGVAASGGFWLLARLLDAQVHLLRQWLQVASHQLDHAEDRILIGQVAEQRESLGRIRRQAMHLRRHFAPLRLAVDRLPTLLVGKEGAGDAERWRLVHDELGYSVDEAAAVYERAKLLQEELASRLAEATNRNLYVLTTWTIVFLPMTLISGIFGMNVDGVPGAGDRATAGPFWLVMLLMLLAGALVFLLLRRRGR